MKIPKDKQDTYNQGLYMGESSYYTKNRDKYFLAGYKAGVQKRKMLALLDPTPAWIVNRDFDFAMDSKAMKHVAKCIADTVNDRIVEELMNKQRGK